MPEVPDSILERLNDGSIEAVNLVEALSVDHSKLFRAVAPDAPIEAIAAMDQAMQGKITTRVAAGGRALLDGFGLDQTIERFMTHRSDTVRAWVAYAIGLAPRVELRGKLTRIASLADDPNSGVREWSWMAVRSSIASDIELAFRLLNPWTSAHSPNLRRFAVESTRPRGVWCQHIRELKDNPSLGLMILEPLHNDPTKYVQDSVSNWLNDAAKSQPDFVKEVCAEWLAKSRTVATQRICRRAIRSIGR